MNESSEFTSQFDLDDRTRICVVTLSGNLDPAAAESLQPRIQELVASGVRRFVFDLGQLHYIGSMGLRLLVELYKTTKADGAVVLCAVNSKVQAILDLTKVRNILQHYPTRPDAIDAVRDR